MKQWMQLLAAIIVGLLGAGLLYLVTAPPRGNAITLRPPPTPAPLAVHVTGAVVRPGVYAFAPGSRVQDAITAAGGLRPDAHVEGLNLAARLEDGVQIQVAFLLPTSTAAPRVTPKPSTMTTATPASAEITAPSPAPAAPGQLINLNTATQSELETLKGIGPATAQKIIDYRTANGPFATIEAIMEVSGIGPATFENIKDFITAGP